ncbi:hypothetical protein MNBD_GAMMA21-1050 [hydrothermal vent metagenome]|uniref:ParD-like antitoxin of type II toxin-antitoxin system n=1 Tax=hydrothermal vent metagenome TaxID=652676 RepID=A0A3B1AAA8_9ZZZZ
MSTPLRVNDGLFQAAEAEGTLMNRSAAKQVEFWAELGKRVAHSVSPSDMLALMQGIAQVQVEVAASKAIDSNHVFTAVENARSSGQLGQKITRGHVYYEASQSKPGWLDKVMSDGQRETGRFENGLFVTE